VRCLSFFDTMRIRTFFSNLPFGAEREAATVSLLMLGFCALLHVPFACGTFDGNEWRGLGLTLNVFRIDLDLNRCTKIYQRLLEIGSGGRVLQVMRRRECGQS